MDLFDIYVNSPLAPPSASLFILLLYFSFGALMQTSIRGLSRTMVLALGALNQTHAVKAAVE